MKTPVALDRMLDAILAYGPSKEMKKKKRVKKSKRVTAKSKRRK